MPADSKPTYAAMIVEAALALKSRKGASRQAIKKHVEANSKGELKPLYFRNGFKKALESGALVQGATKGTFKAVPPAPKKKKAAKKTTKKAAKKTTKKTTKKKSTKKSTKKGSDYKIIKGKKYDAGMLKEADAAVAGAHDNIISMEEASKIAKEALDGHVYTATEKATMKYIRENYKFTDAADKLLRAKVSSFAAKKAAKKSTKKKPAKKAAPKKKTTKKKASTKKKK